MSIQFDDDDSPVDGKRVKCGELMITTEETFVVNLHEGFKKNPVLCVCEHSVVTGNDMLQKQIQSMYSMGASIILLHNTENVEQLMITMVDIGIPTLGIASLRQNYFRMPHTGMLDIIRDVYDQIDIALDKSIMIGASEESMCFAHNVGLAFIHVDVFNGSRQVPDSDPQNLRYSDMDLKERYALVTRSKLEPGISAFQLFEEINAERKIMVILIGPPQSGKYFAAKYIVDSVAKGEKITGDVSFTIVRELSRAKILVKENKNIIYVAQMYSSVKKRQDLYKLAKILPGYKIIILEMTTSYKICVMNDFMRLEYSKSQTTESKRNLINAWFDNYEPRTGEEEVQVAEIPNLYFKLMNFRLRNHKKINYRFVM